MAKKFSAIYTKEGEWWAAYVAEVPGANAQGITLDEARENLRDALSMVLEENPELADAAIGSEVVREDIEI